VLFNINLEEIVPKGYLTAGGAWELGVVDAVVVADFLTYILSQCTVTIIML
jgi:hypothetical protein